MSAFHDSSVIRKYSGWLVALGILNILLGFAALTFVGLATLVSVKALGFILIFSGVSEIALGFKMREDKNSSLSLHLLLGLLSIVVGFFILRDPLVNALAITLFIALLLWVSGFFRILDAILDRQSGWFWVFASGIISVILGTMIFNQWPQSSFWVIGVFVGCDLLSNGLMMLTLGLGGRKLTAR